MIVNPEYETANEIYNMINLPSASQIEKFANGKVNLVELFIDDDNPLAGMSLQSIKKKINTRVLICAVQRGDEVIIPSGNFTVKKGDRISLTADSKSLGAFLSELDLVESPLKTRP